MSKNIGVFSDGTAKEGGQGTNTNVYKLFNMIEDRTLAQDYIMRSELQPNNSTYVRYLTEIHNFHQMGKINDPVESRFLTSAILNTLGKNKTKKGRIYENNDM